MLDSPTIRPVLACVIWLALALICAPAIGSADELFVPDAYGEALFAPGITSPVPLLDGCFIDDFHDSVGRWKTKNSIPIGAGAWHWFNQDFRNHNDGYGIPGMRGTFFWYLTADPELKLANGYSVGGHVDCRFREQDRFRSFYSSQVWTYEAYSYLAIPEFGKIKAGQIQNRFGSDYGGLFWGTTAFFNGIKYDPDYGMSWEGSQSVNQQFKVDHYTQFFVHEDNVNGSIPGADPESVVGFTERNRGVARLVPTWTHDNGAVTALGMSGFVGQIDSRRTDVTDQLVRGWAVDVTHNVGPLKLIGEGMQTFGVFNPIRFTSGGPSDRLTNLLAEAQYVMGPFTHRASHSVSIDDHPRGILSMWTIGTKLAATKNVDVYFEYVNLSIRSSANPTLNSQLNDALSIIIQWRL